MVDPVGGVGAWRIPKAYSRKMAIQTDPWQARRVRYAVIAIQRELIDQNYLVADPSTLDGGFGVKTDAAVRAFQQANGLVVDGQVGPKSTRRLFSPLYLWWQTALGIPNQLLYGQAGLESGFDPGAEGSFDRDDRGVHQYNRHWHPEIDDATAFGNVGWCAQRAAGDLKAAFDKFNRWDCAVAYHNNPAKAAQWAKTGSPPDDIIAEYVKLVYAAALVAT